MAPTSHRLLSLLLSGVLPAALAGQDPSMRGRMTGWVADIAGKRVPNAEVHLLSWPLPPRTDVGTCDHVQVTTDAQGLFRAELLHGRGYSGFAFWRTGDQTHRTSVGEDLVPGPVRGLQEDAAQVCERVRVQGYAAWQVPGLQVLVFTEGTNPQRIELKTDGEMVARLPVLPGSWFAIEVRTNDGQLIGFAPNNRPADQREIVVDLEPPRPVTVRAVDEAGAPIAGAVVSQANAFGYGCYNPRVVPDRLGITDGAGKLLVQLPARAPISHDHTDHILMVEAEGHARTQATVDLAKTQELRVIMPAAPQLCGRVVDAKGLPVAGMTLLADLTAVSQEMWAGFGIHLRPVPTATDGTFRVDGLNPNNRFKLLAAVAPDRARELGLQVRSDFALAPLLWLAVGEPPFPARHDLGDLRLDRLVFARIEVRKCDQQPAPGALLHVAGGNGNSPLVYVTDRLGRLQFPLPRGEVKIGAYLKGGGLARAAARVPPGPDDPTLDPLLLELTEPVSVRGTVVDQDGKPVAGSRVAVWDNGPDSKDPELNDIAVFSRVPSAPTGSDGAFEVFLPCDGVKKTLRAFGPDDKASGGTVMVDIDPGQHQVTGVRIVLVLQK